MRHDSNLVIDDMTAGLDGMLDQVAVARGRYGHRLAVNGVRAGFQPNGSEYLSVVRQRLSPL